MYSVVNGLCLCPGLARIGTASKGERVFRILTKRFGRPVEVTALKTIGGTNKYHWVSGFLAGSLLVVLVIIGTSFSALAAHQSQNPVEIRFLEESALKDWMDRGKAFLLVDARSPEEYARGHIPTAVNVPYPQLAVPRGELEEAGWDDPVVFYCDSLPTGKAGPCATVVARMLQRGANQVYWLKGGMKAWRSLGYPVISPSQEAFRYGASRP